MDPTKQVYESEAVDWQRGLWEDIKRETGMVGSIWRSLMYHEPRFLRYAWGQVKPIFQTREFGAFTIAYRDNVISAAESDLPGYDHNELGLTPSEFTELRGQLECFDVIAPRYHVTFKIMDRLINGHTVGSKSGGEASTRPFPKWLDRDRGRQPMVLPQDEARKAMPESHRGDFGKMVPTEYRSLAHWPGYLERAWDDLEPIFESNAFETAREEAVSLVDTYLDRLPYKPQLDPSTLTTMNFDEETITGLQDFFATFRAGGREFMPTLPVYAATVNVAGERHALVFPD